MNQEEKIKYRASLKILKKMIKEGLYLSEHRHGPDKAGWFSVNHKSKPRLVDIDGCIGSGKGSVMCGGFVKSYGFERER